MMSLTELAIMSALKDNQKRLAIGAAAVGLVLDERFDLKVALKQLDRLNGLKYVDRVGADHYEATSSGLQAVQASVGRLDTIRYTIRQKFFF